MRRRPLLRSLAAVPALLGAGCLERLDVVERGTVLRKVVLGETGRPDARVTGPVAQWLLRDGEVRFDSNTDVSLPADGSALTDGEWDALEGAHAPLDPRLTLCDSPDPTDRGCSGVAVSRETFDGVRPGERAAVNSL
ncbi:MAG: hypothetical protein ABEJ04_05660 [Halobacteriaceae archaeon]